MQTNRHAWLNIFKIAVIQKLCCCLWPNVRTYTSKIPFKWRHYGSNEEQVLHMWLANKEVSKTQMVVTCNSYVMDIKIIPKQIKKNIKHNWWYWENGTVEHDLAKSWKPPSTLDNICYSKTWGQIRKNHHRQCYIW